MRLLNRVAAMIDAALPRIRSKSLEGYDALFARFRLYQNDSLDRTYWRLQGGSGNFAPLSDRVLSPPPTLLAP